MQRAFVYLMLFLAVLLGNLTHAQVWPSGSVRIVVPYPAGSGPDIVARILADRLGAKHGAAVIVDNRPGGNGIIGATYVARSAPDGNTLLLTDRLTLSSNPLLQSTMPYARSDLMSVINVADAYMFLVVSSSLPVQDFKELISYLKANPGKVAFGSGGSGSIMHFSLEAIQAAAGVQMQHVPYKGFSEVIGALLSGDVAVSTGSGEAIQKLVESGKLRLLAYGARTRNPVLPNIPTIVEAGGSDDMLLSSSYSLFARAGTPASLVAAVNKAFFDLLKEPEMVARIAARGIEARPGTPAALDARIDADYKHLDTLIRERGIKIN